MSDPNLQRQIESELQPGVRELENEHAAQKNKVQKVINEISEALRQRNTAAIRQSLETLTELVTTYAGLLPRAKTLMGRLEKLVADNQGSNEHKSLAALANALEDLQGKMDRNYLKLKELQDKANDALAAGKSRGATIAQEWAEMESWMNDNLKLARTRLEQIKVLHGLAVDAVAERDVAELVQMQRKNEERTGWKPTAADVNSRLIQFFAKGEPKLSDDLRDQATRDRVKFDKMAREITDIHKQIDGVFEQTKALKIKPIDTKKAASVLELPSGSEAKLKKALESDAPLDRALDTLAKELKIKTSGSDMVAKLKKAKLL